MIKIDRVLNGRINHIIVNGIPASQHYNIEKALDELYLYLVEHQIEIKSIIEIGTLNGGFTTLLANHKISNNACIHTFDIADKKHKNFNHLEKIICHLENVFESKTIANCLNAKENYLLFCDGGNKIREFNTFAPFLKSNDFIFCHDYIKTKELFEEQYKNKIWNWHESNFNGIKESVEKHNLQSILPEFFESAVWSSYKKI